jgi:uncharacterized nucleotidyltransferase DUF6036
MKPVAKFGLDVLRREFEAVAAHIRKPTTVYLIGGCAMSFARLKTATKDVDLVLADPAHLPALREALKAEQFRPLTGLRKEYQNLGAAAYYGKPEAPQFDIFLKRVANKLWLSPGMMERAVPAEMNQTNLQVLRVAPQDIFIFKSITERVADQDDMDTIFAAGLDWEAVLREMEWQSKHSKTPWSDDFLTSMEAFAERGNAVPILPRLRELRDRDVAEHFVLEAIRKNRNPLEQVGQHDPGDVEFVQGIINDLVGNGTVRRHSGRLTIGELPWLDR